MIGAMTKETTTIKSKYPWESWLDGRVWLLRVQPYGSDFDCLAASIRGQAAKVAAKVGLAVTSRNAGEVGILLQAYPEGSTWKPNLAVIDWRTIKRAAMVNPRGV